MMHALPGCLMRSSAKCEVADTILDNVIEFFNWSSPFGRNMPLGLTQHLEK